VMAGFGGALLSYFPEGSAAREYENYGRILAFTLDGGPIPLPPRRDREPDIPAPPLFDLAPQEIERGKELYFMHCVGCHMIIAKDNLSGYPNLALLTPEMHKAFQDIVIEGIMSFGGMASFSDVLSEEDVTAIQAYIATQQRELQQQKD